VVVFIWAGFAGALLVEARAEFQNSWKIVLLNRNYMKNVLYSYAKGNEVPSATKKSLIKFISELDSVITNGATSSIYSHARLIIIKYKPKFEFRSNNNQ